MTPKSADLFQILRDGAPRTRSELAQITGMARSTVASRVDALTRVGLVVPVGEAASTGGRPSSQFALNPRGRVALGVDVGASHVRVAITDLGGSTVAVDSAEIEVSEGPERVLSWVVDSGRRLLDELPREYGPLAAVGVGVPGPVEHATGMPVDPPIMPGWDRFDVRAHVTTAFGAPTLVDNDVNIMALGERELAWSSVDDLIFVKVATGIGAGVISGGLLQRGAQGTAGDIGHVYVPRAADVLCRCGNYGCLEAIASGAALARKLRGLGLAAESSQDVIDLVRGGSTDAIHAVRDAGRTIGEVLTACVSIINPAVIVLGGTMAAAGEHLLAGVREVVYGRSMPLATGNLQIVASRSADDAAVLGACMLAIEHALSPASVEAMLGR